MDFFHNLFFGGKKQRNGSKRSGIPDSIRNEMGGNAKNAKRDGSRLTSLNGGPSGVNVFDVCAYVIVCEKHKKVCLSREETTHFIWLPYISIPESKTWTDGARDGAHIVLANGNAKNYMAFKAKPVFTESHCMQIFRLQLPQTQKLNIRLIYYAKISKTHSIFKCCSNTERLHWYSVSDVLKGNIGAIWGPEVREFLGYTKKPAKLRNAEFSLDEAFFYVPRDPPRNLEEELLKSANYTDKDVERIYGDFSEHCFPSFYMTVHSFSDYMSKYGFEKRDKKLKLLFRAFNFHNTGFLSFSEFLLGLTSIEPNAGNGQSRIKLVFKYYDVDGDGFLSDGEFRTMIREINPKINETQIKECMKRIGVKSQGVAFDDFFKACGSRNFRGTSRLCRSNISIVSKISQSMATRGLHRTKADNFKIQSFAKLLKYKGVCKSCKEKTYELCLHSVKLNSLGRCVDPRPLSGSGEKSSDSLIKSDVSDKSKSKGSGGSLNVVNISREKFSTEIVWNTKSVANYLMEQIRAFNKKKGSHKDNNGLLAKDGKDFLIKLEQLCSEVEKIVGQEERCVRLHSPAYIIGDIHGNIEDLFTMERVLWKGFPVVGSNYVFLGDYVDRGKWGLECTVYVLCMKLLAPNKVVVLRGNHEVRDLQKHYTYRKECRNKYGDTIGLKVWETTNRVFDKLPICAVVDDSIYCAHGGIPCTTRPIAEINKVKADLPNPEEESAIAWEILWSDPIGAQQFRETAELLKLKVEGTRGFLTNTKRGTAFLFAEEAANNFLQSNDLTHIIRAHEVPAQGFTFHFGNRCTTIFSSSHYCGNDNIAACIHLDREKLRIIRLDTKNNAPAS